MTVRRFIALLRPGACGFAASLASSRLITPSVLRCITTTTRRANKDPDRQASAAQHTRAKTMLEDESTFGFVRHNTRPPKPRKVGVTEIRGPYYSAMGKRYLQDVLET
jgi:hypothetical protein